MNAIHQPFDANRYCEWPYRFASDLMDSNLAGETPLRFSPWRNGRKTTFEISAHHLSFVDFVCLKLACARIPDSEENDGSLGRYEFSEYLKKEELDEINIPVAYAGAYISSTEQISGNWYNSNCDTYGSAMGYPAYSLYFLYVTDLDRFVLVTNTYYEM